MSETINPEFGARAVSVYGGGDAMDDFPVLKAFQQYIDAEQAKARKRLLAMGVFFGVFTLVVVAVFVALLVSVSNRNQQLNDRLVEFAMKERASGSAVVVQPPQDTSAVLALTTKLEEMNRKIAEAQAKADKAVAEAEEKARQAAAAAAAAQPKPPSAEELEIQRLKAQLADEKARAEAEKKALREKELDAYRRKHYPEYYAEKEAPASAKPVAAAKPVASAKPVAAADDDEATHADVEQLLSDLDDILKDDAGEAGEDDGSLEALEPIDYLEGEGDARKPAKKPAAKAASAAKPKAKSASKARAKPKAAAKPARSVSVGTGENAVDWGIPD